MKRIIGFLTMLTGMCVFQVAQAQDVSFNITNPATVFLGEYSYVLVTLCNEDPSPIDAPGGKLRPQLSVSPNVTITGVTAVDGSPLTGFTIQDLSTGNNNTIRMLYDDVLVNGDCISFHVTIRGTVASGNILFNGSLGFQGPQTPGNNVNNDNSPSGISVRIRPVTDDDAETTTPNTPVDIIALTNDTPGAPTGEPGHSPIVPGSVLLIDPADGIKKSTVTIPGEGTFTVNATTGLVTFVPALNYVGTSSVDYTIKDEFGSESNVSTITVTITPLPVTLISFTAAREGKTANLAWSTTEETNSDRFEIERSQGGKDWAKIGTVQSHGESTVKRNYTFADVNPLNGENLYRLKMIDNDATFAYSRIRSAKFEGANQTGSQISVYPNPSSDKVYLKDADVSQINGVSIVDVNGRAVYSSKSVSADGINVNNLSAGMYILSVKNLDGTSKNHKLLISR